jgi:zona occludens toxin (predicted ATPase)
MKKSALMLIVMLVLTGCGAPLSPANQPLSTFNKDTAYSIRENENGFTITVTYSRYRATPQPKAVAAVCKSQLKAKALEFAYKEIEPINEQQIKVTLSRRPLSGILSCEASANVLWRFPGKKTAGD